MPAGPTGLEELLAQIATCIHYTLHPASTLLSGLGLGAVEGLDIAMWALLTWFLGSREREGVKKAGLVLAALLAALALLEHLTG